MPQPPHVLIVEDHDQLLAVLARLLAQIYPGASIALAANGADALLAYTQQRADLIITDYHMPIAGGLNLVRTLRGQGEAIPILVLSADPSIAAAVLAAGADQFLLKPFRLVEFTQILRTLLPT